MHTRKRSSLLVAALAVALCLPMATVAALSSAGPALLATSAPLVTAAVSSAAPTAAHPFSDPLWFPLREPVRVSCTYSNEGCDGYHGYWAIDLLGDLGDPVFPAGAGVLHIGAVDGGCRTSITESTGTWVWVDHGGGLVTKYNHLDGLTATEGQLVTPATQIGTMGHSGDTAPCTTNYLHFEVRTGGITGTRIDPGTLRGCTASGQQSYPGAWGYTSWNNLRKAQQWTPTLTNDCLPEANATTEAPSPVSATRGDGTVRVAWAQSSATDMAVDHYTISSEIWGPSVSAWHSLSFRSVPATQLATTFRGLDNGRTFRFRVVSHSAAGNSAWTAYVKGTPAAAPLAPGTDRNLVAGATYVRFGWYGCVPRGAPVTSYEVAIRHWTGTAWSSWSYGRTPAAELTYRWDGLQRGTTYQMRVRGHSSVGTSSWGIYRKLTTLR